jgi:D-alanyl-D-alanine carboxypeptidase
MVVGQSATIMLSKLHQELGIPSGYGRENSLPSFAEATELVEAGPNLVGRMQSLTPEAAGQWHDMVVAAAADGITLMIVSGYRSFAYQAGLIRKKIDAGQEVTDILTVNAAPGYSEHHSGRAVDIASPGSRPLTEEFEVSEAFGWLEKRAKEFDFSLTYPRDNRYGFIYEPWHWSINS